MNRLKINKYLPFVICLSLPALNFINSSQFTFDLDLLQFFPRWLSASLILLVLWYIDAYITRTQNNQKFVILLILNVIVISIYVFIIYNFFPDQFPLLNNVNYWTIGFKFLLASAIFITIQYSIKSTKDIERLRTENEILIAERYKTDLENLRRQVHPHFLFNALNTLRSMVRSQEPKTEEFVVNLSEFYRQSLHHTFQDFVQLDEELKLLSNYIHLLKIKHHNALEVNYNIGTLYYKMKIPVFALQILIENAVKHNVVSEQKPLCISVFTKNEDLLVIENYINKKRSIEPSEGMGLQNLISRYQLVTKKNGIQIFESSDKFIVEIKLIPV